MDNNSGNLTKKSIYEIFAQKNETKTSVFYAIGY
jgi:hypothetical protein